jgi:hypothetical protein
MPISRTQKIIDLREEVNDGLKYLISVIRQYNDEQVAQIEHDPRWECEVENLVCILGYIIRELSGLENQQTCV